MKVKIEQIVACEKSKNGKDYTRIKTSDGQFINVMALPDALSVGMELEMDPKPFGKNKWAHEYTVLNARPNASHSNGLAGVTWDDYSMMMSLVFDAAKALEPDDAQARAAMVNTALIAFTNGKIRLSDDDKEEAPF